MLFVIPIDEQEQWDETIRSFANYDVYYMSGYVKAHQKHGDGDPLLFYYSDKDVRGINVVMKRDIAEDPHFYGKIKPNSYFDFKTPYGYGGWLIEGENPHRLFEEYEKWCHQSGIVSEFVRFHPVIKNHLSCTEKYDVVGLGNTVTLDLSSREIIWANLTSKNRNMIRKAQKNGIRVYNGRYPAIYEIFRDMYNGTMDKDNAEAYYYFEEEYYKSILEDLPQNAEVFYAEYEGKPVAASIMLMTNGKMNYHLSGSVREFASFAPTNLILYQAALWGWANGCRTLYLGGGVGSSDDKLFAFKKSFYRGDNLNRFYIGRKIFLKDVYDNLLQLRDDLTENNFFPEYRS